jgi:hypothetical protein
MFTYAAALAAEVNHAWSRDAIAQGHHSFYCSQNRLAPYLEKNCEARRAFTFSAVAAL